MKTKATLTIVLMILTLITFGQSQRFILFEEGTNAGCPPCASQNPAFDALLQANEDKCTAIKYHAWWPGNDPMYNHNTEDNAVRINYYGINVVPRAVMDGYQQGSPSSFNQGAINSRSAIPSPFDMSSNWYLSPEEDIIYVDLLIQATADVSGDLVGHMVVVEEAMHYSSAPGTNGEKDFYDVMKKMLPDAHGTDLENFETGDYVILQGSWELANIMDMNELGVVCFVQDNSGNKEIQQACKGTTDPLTPAYGDDVEVMQIKNVFPSSCIDTVAPVVTIRNNGSSELTSLIIYYNVNGGDEVVYNWSGNLGFLETEDVQLATSNFIIEDLNNLHVICEMPNGNTDEYPKNDNMIFEFDRAMYTPQSISLMLFTDDDPNVFWEVTNSNNEVVASGGPYTEPLKLTLESIDVDDADCYTFTISDENGFWDPGFYKLYYGSTIITQGEDFESSESVQFFADDAVSVAEFDDKTDVSVYPNPASTKATIAINLNIQNNVNVNVFDMVGKQVYSEDLGYLANGQHTVTFDGSQLPKGVYFVKVQVGNVVYNEKLTLR